MSAIRKGWLVRGVRAAIVAFVILIAVVPRRGGRADEGDKLQGTFVVQVRLNASFETKWSDELQTYNDTLNVSCDGTTTYRWTDTLPEAGQPTDDLEVLSTNSTLSVSGEGTHVVRFGGSARWSYFAPPTPKQVAHGEIIWRNGKLRIPVPWHCASFRQIGQSNFGRPEPINRYEKFGFPTEEPSFTDKLKQTFERKAKSFNVSGEASWQGNCAAFGFDTCSTALASKYTPQARYSVSYSVSFNTGKPPDVEVEMEPAAEYNQWVPEAAEDENSLGNFIDVGIVAHKKGDPNKPPGQKVLKYTIALVDTSKEKGVNLNWPANAPQNPAFDMKIDKDNPWITLANDNAQSAQTKQEDLHDFRVTVNSYDWGGWTKLKVTAELEDHSTVVAHVKGHPDREYLAIPKDDNMNHIADWWEHWFSIKNPDENADDDNTPRGDGDDGDSIALYDEYRGFRIHGKPERLSPEIKDLFVWDQNHIGTGIYAQITGVSVHVIDADERELRGEHTIVSRNGNRETVYAIWLRKAPIGDGGVGDTDGGPGVPAKIRSVTIDTALIEAAYGAYAASEKQSTIAHELGHATNIWHHGEKPPDYDVGDVLCRRPDGSVKNFLCSSPSAGGPRKRAEDCYEVAAKGGMYSGNDSCVMRYDMTHFYENPNGNCEWKRGGRKVLGKLYGQDPPGMSLCESPRGTGVNDASNPDNKAGDASAGRGECKYKFCLNNKKH
jgi:hypothetical protein